MTEKIPVAVLGGTGYVAGELLRLIALHPAMQLAAVASSSRAGQPVAETFPNLAAGLGSTSFVPPQHVIDASAAGRLAGVFSATPHGAAAPLISSLLASAGDSPPTVVDASADFRFTDVKAYQSVYGHAHGAPGLQTDFCCAVPEHLEGTPTAHAAHPGCFATAMLLAVVPLLRSGLAESEFFAAGVTGSTGSGRSPLATTHHPERHANLYAYKPLAHRHAPEVAALAAAASGTTPRINFIPHSGPFARGIHMTVQGRLTRPDAGSHLRAAFAAAYADSPFVEVLDAPPRIKDVVGSNRARLCVHSHDDRYVVMVVIDNLVKGAAGGAMQWMNRLLGCDETAGLTAAGPAWI
ncbi:MAG: N-acetyl-gamma-glutamyl-phosphate reductase [Gammaproteobacteria bacterium]